MNENRLRAMIEPIKRRIMMAFGRAVLRAVNDDLARQLLQVEILKGELRDQVERMQNYGFTSVPFAGADAAVAFVGGDRAHGIVLVVDDRRYRLTGLAAGEVAMYDDQGQKVHITRTGIVVETTLDLTATVGGDLTATVTGALTASVTGAVSVESDASVTITAPTISLVGALSVTGAATLTGDVATTGNLTNNGAYIGGTHKHDENNVLGGPTGGPHA